MEFWSYIDQNTFSGYLEVHRSDASYKLKVAEQYYLEGMFATKIAPLLGKWQHIALEMQTNTTLYINGEFGYSVVQSIAPVYACKFALQNIKIIFKQFRMWSYLLQQNDVKLYSQM